MKVKTAWDLDLILKEEEMEAEKERVFARSYEFIDKWKDREDYLIDPKILAEALSEYEQWQRNTGLSGKLGYFWSLQNSLDQTNPEIKAKINQTTDLANQIQNGIQFFEHKISRMKPIDVSKLQNYRHFLERLWENAKFLLSEPEEKIMTLKANSSYIAWEKMTAGLISKEERAVAGKKKFFSEIYNLISDPDKKTRAAAALTLNDIFNRWVEVGEAEINAILNDKKVNDDIRQMERPDLSRHVLDGVDSKMVDCLIEAVSERFDIPARFYKLKAKLLGVSKLEYYERSVPYGKLDKKYSFAESVELIKKVFEKIDPEFRKIFVRFLENGQVDVFPARGKRSGAFCSSDLIVTPTFVLLNHDDKLENVLALAHEFGHAINAELTRVQSPLYFHTSLATAEVASTFFEGFVLDELMKDADGELKLALMIKQLDDDMGTIFRQVAMYEFEKDLHTNFREKGYLAKEEIGELWVKHAVASMGPAVNKTPGSENWWLYVPHIRDFFYVYSYASGQLISQVLQAKVRNDGRYMQEVKKFLAAGTSKSPKELFLDMGVDISKKSFWEKGILEIEKLMDETEALAKKLKKI